jgi:hypothetical protein
MATVLGQQLGSSAVATGAGQAWQAVVVPVVAVMGAAAAAVTKKATGTGLIVAVVAAAVAAEEVVVVAAEVAAVVVVAALEETTAMLLQFQEWAGGATPSTRCLPCSSWWRQVGAQSDVWGRVACTGVCDNQPALSAATQCCCSLQLKCYSHVRVAGVTCIHSAITQVCWNFGLEPHFAFFPVTPWSPCCTSPVR